MIEPEDTMAVTATRRRFTLAEYHRMGEVGILRPDDRVELIDGEIIEMAPIGTLHAATVTRICEFFVRRLGDRATIRSQNPLLIPDHESEPEPDVMLLTRRADFYARAHPVPADVRLLIEVADSSLRYDRLTKFPLYARAGVAEAWLVDVEHRRVELHRRPAERGYAEISRPETGDGFASLAFPDIEVTGADMLG